jgi:hypothetical protein
MKTRQELKEEYKQIKYKMGVFQIRNTINQKVFVGSSTDLVAIWHRNRLQLNFGNHPNEELQQDWKAAGEAHFVYEILGELKQDEKETTDYAKEVKVLEQMYLDELRPYGERGYNKPPK